MTRDGPACEPEPVKHVAAAAGVVVALFAATLAIGAHRPPTAAATTLDTCADDGHPFTDVSASSFAADSVACIFNLGITTGTTATTYSPSDLVTREQMAAFLARLWDAVGEPCDLWSVPFADVAVDSFAAPGVSCIAQLGITTGTSETTYSPSDLVTREQMAAFLARLLRSDRYEEWTPSVAGSCEVGVNVSPVHESTTSIVPEGRVVYEPGVVYADETFTAYRRAASSATRIPMYVEDDTSYVALGDAAPAWWLYDDGSHGDAISGDGVYTRACLSVNPAEPPPDPVVMSYDLMVVDPALRGSEPVTAVRPGMQQTETALFVEIGSVYGNRWVDSWSFNGIEDCVACAMAWDEYGSIFDMFTIVMRDATGGAGYFRVHDVIEGTGFAPDCSFSGYCYDVIGPDEHPELIGLIHMNYPNFDGLLHEMVHGFVGVETKDFPLPGGRAWNAGDGIHFDSSTTLSGGLVGPLWDPDRGHPFPVVLEGPGDTSSEVRIDGDGTNFWIRPPVDEDFRLTDVELYMMGLLSAAEAAASTEYKLYNPALPGCVADDESLVCPEGNDTIVPEEVIDLTVGDLVDRYGPWAAPSSFAADVVDMGTLVVSDRPLTDAEIVFYTGASREAMATDPRGVMYDDYTWHYATGGRSVLRTDLYD